MLVNLIPWPNDYCLFRVESRESSSDEEGKEVSAAAASLERPAQTEPQPQTQTSTLSYRKSLRLSSDQIVSLQYFKLLC